MAEPLPCCDALQAALAALAATPSKDNAGVDAVEDAKHRLACVRQVRELWLTRGGKYDPACLAEHYTDGTGWVLERFLYYGTELSCTTQPPLRSRTIATVHARDLTYDEFFRHHLIPNRPVVVQGVTSNWNAAQDWVTGTGTPDVLAIARSVPHAVAPVVGVWADDPTRVISKQTRVRDYAYWWAQRHDEITPDVEGSDGSWESHRDLNGEKLYLKDWHFASEYGDEYPAYSCPLWFRDDWLHLPGERPSTANSDSEPEQKQQERDRDGGRKQQERDRDHRFVYLGPAGSTTRMHCDVMASYSWSVNVCGTKRWQLLPPSSTPLLFDALGDTMAADLSDCCTWFGGLATARDHAVEVIQRSGEAIFVPSGWHHSVENLDPTLSINHNWFNACCLEWVVDHCLSRLQLDLTTSSLNASGSNSKSIRRSETGGAAEQEARLLGAVVNEAAARACRVCLEEGAAQTARCLKAVYDFQVAQKALDRLQSAGIHTVRGATSAAMDSTASMIAETVVAASAVVARN